MCKSSRNKIVVHGITQLGTSSNLSRRENEKIKTKIQWTPKKSKIDKKNQQKRMQTKKFFKTTENLHQSDSTNAVEMRSKTIHKHQHTYTKTQKEQKKSNQNGAKQKPKKA